MNLNVGQNRRKIMSIIRCTDCGHWIDTDYESEFYARGSRNPICESCLAEYHEEEEEEDEH